MQILITSQNIETLRQAVDFTILFTEQAAVTVLYAYQNDRDRNQNLDTLEHLGDKIRLVNEGSVRILMKEGKPKDVILNETRARDYDLVVFGSHRRPHVRNLRPKRDARQIAQRISLPMLIVFPHQNRLSRVLMCIGGTETDQVVLQQGGLLTSQVEAACGILHVMSQIPLRAGAELEDLERDASSLIEHETKEGNYLEEAREDLVEQGIEREKCRPVVRHGLTVNEIIQESQEGEYDLIVVGGLDVSPNKSWHELRELVQEDIADKVLAQADRPVLIARKPDTKISWKGF